MPFAAPLRSLLAALPLLALAAGPLRAEEAPAEASVPERATDPEARSALEAFEAVMKTKGLKGDDRIALQVSAMHELARVQHASVIDRLVRLAKGTNADLRTQAIACLGKQRALPAAAGAQILQAADRGFKDSILVMVALDALAELGYRGATDFLLRCLKHKDEFVVKTAYLAIGDLGEMRLIDEVLKTLKDLKIDSGVSWEGGSVTYDTGAAGTHDQEMAEKIYHERYGNNAAAGRRAGRRMRDLGPIVLECLKRLTGEEFSGGTEARQWASQNAQAIEARKRALAEAEKAQKEGA